ncbi:hypothetical protein BMS3Bbin02_00618 [bacterium BMS3Bbin02]|nr:hypothetical protein BMS3Bbin02_00618 [bacterium BMS3Bbin02]
MVGGEAVVDELEVGNEFADVLVVNAGFVDTVCGDAVASVTEPLVDEAAFLAVRLTS